MKVSARNVFLGTVVNIKKGAVNAEVVIDLKGGCPVVSTITNGAVENLGLKEAMEAYAIIKASSVIVGTDLHDARLSARNVMKGTIARIIEGPVSAEVAVDVGAGHVVTAVITLESARSLGLKQGGQAYVLFKASSVIVGVR